VNGRLPTALDGVQVTIAEKPAFVEAISPGQINVQAPDLPPGKVDVVVKTAAGNSAPFQALANPYSPAFWPWPGNQPVATHLDYSYAVRDGTFPSLKTVSSKPGETVTLWVQDSDRPIRQSRRAWYQASRLRQYKENYKLHSAVSRLAWWPPS